MRWEEQGAGVPVIFVHGIPTSPALWRHVVPRIAGARCLAFEMVGYGASIPDGRGRDISVARQADYLFAWAKTIGVNTAVLAGHDLGGGVVQIAALRHPGFCRGLFLTNAIGYDSWPIPSVKALRAAGPLVRRLPNAVAKQIIATLMVRGHDDRSRIAESLEVHWAPYARHGGAQALIRQIDALRAQDTLGIAGELPHLRLPARIAWGTADPFQKLRYGERFARDLLAPLRQIAGGRHFTPEDHPDIIAEEIGLLLHEVGKFA
ncbi:alpha/beta fold hydrolase [Methylibium sp.]|uniref:alpha/beta fold hydrolase n=1 Tax=Methylibium sp. TaxID=2067992 RepID=UPI0025F61E86|nr:alpha/beta fold hydrolase [Methylibium sp.]